MRRRRCKASLAIVAAALVFGGAVGDARAQGAVATEGALFLLLPVGARAVGMGQAVVADRGGSEAIWWNPAGLGRVDAFEAAIHHSQTLVATGDAVSLVVPFSLLGVFAASADVVNFGEQEITDPTGPVGTLLPRGFVFAGTYATGIGARLTAGVTYKIVQLRFDCTGLCPNLESISARTSALDLGVQFEPSDALPVTVGVALRNVGVRLQLKDSDQADPLPTRVHVGAVYRLPRFEGFEDTEIRVAGDLVDRLQVASPSARFGAELIHQNRFFLRAGYVVDEGGGATIGAGVATGGLLIDIARVMGGFSADAGEPPVHLSLRYQF